MTAAENHPATTPSTPDDQAEFSDDNRWWPWKTIDAATLTRIHRMVSTWPRPSSSQLDAVAVLRPSTPPAPSPPASVDHPPAQRCA